MDWVETVLPRGCGVVMLEELYPPWSLLAEGRQGGHWVVKARANASHHNYPAHQPPPPPPSLGWVTWLSIKCCKISSGGAGPSDRAVDVFWLWWLDTYLASHRLLFTNSNLPGRTAGLLDCRTFSSLGALRARMTGRQGTSCFIMLDYCLMTMAVTHRDTGISRI